ncbi:MAG: general secretion pathway protein GspB [Syntrophobacteraceae bacterium]|jgi:hypothetical protein|nr:general secretion pathway protein GspB [Syntrophobacteraceae bacterium]
MAKREKILVIVALLAAVYGLFQVMRPQPRIPSAGSASATRGDSSEILQRIATELRKQDLTESEAAMLARATASWGEDPFVGKKLVPLGEVSRLEPDSAKDLDYTGYISSGTRKLAIINGLEYVVGDRLVTGGFILRSISPDAVILESTGAPGTVTLPFAEE